MPLPLKHLFALPEGVVYLNGNSLGPLPRAASARAREVVDREWGGELIRAWNTADWITLPRRVGDRIARLIGAPEGSVATGDTLSIKVYQALAAALSMRPDRRVILTDTGNFPTDLYMAEGLIRTIRRGHEIRAVAPEDVAGALDASVAALLLTEVDYRTGRRHDMAALTAAAHRAGAVAVWDLAHSVGAVPVDVTACGAEFAIGCTYKYLNGGPGAPAFVYVRPDLATRIEPALSGWMGHDAPFAMEPAYRPAMSTERMRVGTPPVIQLAILDAALELWDGLDMAAVHAASAALADAFVARVEAGGHGLALASPRDAARRGSHVAFRFTDAYAVMRALIEHGVIGDFREPDTLRFGFSSLFLDQADVARAAATLAAVLQDGSWRDPQYGERLAVT